MGSRQAGSKLTLRKMSHRLLFRNGKLKKKFFFLNLSCSGLFSGSEFNILSHYLFTCSYYSSLRLLGFQPNAAFSLYPLYFLHLFSVFHLFSLLLHSGRFLLVFQLLSNSLRINRTLRFFRFYLLDPVFSWFFFTAVSM